MVSTPEDLAIPGELGGEEIEERRSPLLHNLRELLADLLSDRVALLGMSGTIFFIILAVGAPVIAPHDPTQQSLRARLMPPVWAEGGY